ncbi:efflux RND transporter permease subunit [candidate division KSB1 bacterium]
MKIISRVVHRPVAVLMFYLVILFVGVMSSRRLPLELIPNVEFPRMSVNAAWGKTSPEVVEKFVTSKIEGICNTINGVQKITSVSSEGQSSVSMEFSPKVNMDLVSLELREKLNLITDELPFGIRPNISRYVPRDFDEGDFLTFRLTGDMSLIELRKFAMDKVKIPLQGVDGVANVEVIGGLTRQIRIIADPDKLKSFGLTEDVIKYSLYGMDLDEYIGSVEENGIKYFVLIDDKIRDLKQIENHIVLNRDGKTIRLKDFAEVTDTYTEPSSISRINGNPSVSIRIDKESGTNTIKVRDDVFAKIAEMEKTWPESVAMINDSDSSVKIRTELNTLSFRAVFSIIVIFIILFIFIRNVRVPLIILSTIFFSELLALTFFYWAGIGLNLITLAGLALGFGMIVDNSIVVLDNIFRYREKNLDRITSSERGTREVALPIIASTLTTIVAFLPFLYLTGENRAYYLPFALAVALSLFASLLVAFTYIPALAARFISLENHAVSGKKKSVISAITGFYSRGLRYIIRFRWVTLAVVIVIFLFSYRLFDKYVTKGRIWRSWGDVEYLSVRITLPRGTELETTDEIIKEFESIALKEKDKIKIVSTTVQATYAYMKAEFPDSIIYTAYPYNVKSELVYNGALHAGIDISIYGFGDGVYFSGLGRQSYGTNITVKGYNYDELEVIAEDIAAKLKRHKRIDNVTTTNSLNWRYGSGSLNETVLKVDREKLGRYDITVQNFLNEVSRYLKGSGMQNRIKIDGEEVNYLLKIEGFDQFQLNDLKDILIFSNSGEKIRLADVAHIEEQRVMSSIVREDQQYARYISYEWKGPYQMHQKFRETVIENTRLPNGYSFAFRDRIFMGEAEKRELYFVIAIAVLLVYMMTAALYESFLLPLVIIVTVPMALIGVFLTFFLFDKGFDRSAYIGVVLLAGIVVNNSIILVDHINRLRLGGMDFIDAVVQGAVDRVRPILMTSTTTVFAMLPLVLTYFGKTQEEGLWQALSLSTIGGLVTATPLTLTVIPVLLVIIRKMLRNRETSETRSR